MGGSEAPDQVRGARGTKIAPDLIRGLWLILACISANFSAFCLASLIIPVYTRGTSQAGLGLAGRHPAQVRRLGECP
jgi:hypothetical protein